jgi:excisionase family DNA binding protein
VAGPDPDADLFVAIREQYPPLLTAAQVGELLHVGPRTVLAMAADGRLKASRLPGTRQYNFFREDVIRVLEENLVRPGDTDLHEVAGAEPPPAKGPARRSRR